MAMNCRSYFGNDEYRLKVKTLLKGHRYSKLIKYMLKFFKFEYKGKIKQIYKFEKRIYLYQVLAKHPEDKSYKTYFIILNKSFEKVHIHQHDFLEKYFNTINKKWKLIMYYYMRNFNIRS